jgi:hypothetical protein
MAVPKNKNPNIGMLEAAVERLGPLIDEVVFLGGCVTGLLLTDPAAPPLRTTLDVDIMVNVVSLADYHQFNQRLRECGFTEDLGPEAPICRWQSENMTLDVMPTDPKLLGFGNQWFSKAFSAARHLRLPSGAWIRVLPSPYFMATKIEAFHHRGVGDFLLSRDIEDLVAILDGRLEIVVEVMGAEPLVLNFLAEQLSAWLVLPDFLDALPGLLPPDTASQARVSTIISRIREITTFGLKQKSP